MSQLREVLQQFEQRDGAVSLNRMARDMALEPGVLQDMIGYWVRKGKLREVVGESKTCHSCGIKSACPFIIAMPRYYELVREGERGTDDAPPCSCSTGTCQL